MTDHPLTKTAAAEMWEAHAGETVAWDDWYGGSQRALTSLLRAAFDAGRDHERAAKELPTEPGTVIVPADGCEYIEAEVWGKTYHASEAILLGERDWLGAWRSPHGVQVDVTSRQITPGTWKVGNR